MEFGKVNNEQPTERSKAGAQPRSKSKADENKPVSIHDQDTAEIEIPDFAKKDEEEKAA